MRAGQLGMGNVCSVAVVAEFFQITSPRRRRRRPVHRRIRLQPQPQSPKKLQTQRVIQIAHLTLDRSFSFPSFELPHRTKLTDNAAASAKVGPIGLVSSFQSAHKRRLENCHSSRQCLSAHSCRIPAQLWANNSNRLLFYSHT